MVKNDINGVLSFVFSILGLLTFIIFPPVGLVFSIVSIVLFRMQSKIKNTSLSLAGLVMGVIGIIVNGIFVVMLIVTIILVLLRLFL